MIRQGMTLMQNPAKRLSCWKCSWHSWCSIRSRCAPGGRLKCSWVNSMEDSRRSTTTIASGTAMLIISIKLNCFITSRSLCTTFNRCYPASVGNGDGWQEEKNSSWVEDWWWSINEWRLAVGRWAEHVDAIDAEQPEIDTVATCCRCDGRGRTGDW